MRITDLTPRMGNVCVKAWIEAGYRLGRDWAICDNGNGYRLLMADPGVALVLAGRAIDHERRGTRRGNS